MSDCPEDKRYLPAYTVEGEPLQREDDCGTTPQPPEESSEAESSEADDIRTFTFDQLSILCSDIGLSPEMVEGVLAQLLTQHFSDPEWIIYPELRQYVWTPKPETTKIQILPLNFWSAAVDGTRPGIIYSDLGQKAQRFSIGDQGAQSRDRPAQSYARAYTGGHRLMCLGQNDFQASQLASEIERWLTEFTPVIIASLPFHDFQVADRQAPQSFSALGDRVGVALTVTYAYIWSWETYPYGAPLKSLSTHPTTEG